MEADLGAVGAEHRVPAAADPERVHAVGLQVTHHGAGTIHRLGGPPHAAVLVILLGGGLSRSGESGEKEGARPPGHIVSECVWGAAESSVGAHLRYSRTWWSVGRWSSDNLQQIVASL